MKTQLKNSQILASQTPAAPATIDAEPSRIAAAISRILLIKRAQESAQKTAEPVAASASNAQTPKRPRDATPVEWALRMMF